jgi:chromosome segregation ATPase
MSEHRNPPMPAPQMRKMAERPDLDGRDPATLTELEKLAYIYPEVAELVRERDALRRRVDELRPMAAHGMQHLAQKNRAEVERLRRDLTLQEEVTRQVAARADELRAQVASLTGEHDDERAEVERINIAVAIAEANRAELERLRARDEAAKAVARLWDGTVYDTTNENPLWAALDTLARTHEEGGRDR